MLACCAATAAPSFTLFWSNSFVLERLNYKISISVSTLGVLNVRVFKCTNFFIGIFVNILASESVRFTF